jgi:hypothetical protein
MARIESSPEIWHRDDFPILCNWRKLFRAVEVGLDRGDYAERFLRWWQGHRYWGVDNYLPLAGLVRARSADLAFAATRLERFGERARIVLGDSVDVAAIVEPGSFDWVYIDAGHDYENVRADLNAWWPVVSENGILAGHDFTPQNEHAGVIPAVTEFAEAHNLTIYTTSVAGYGQEVCPSWYIYKSGLPDGSWRRC